MTSERTLLTLAVLAAAVSLVSTGFIYYSFSSLQENWITGFASTTNATINLTVTTNADINFTNSTIDWGSGAVSDGAVNATLQTSSAGATVTTGSWTIIRGATGFVLENIGNVNVSLCLSTLRTAATFLGGTNPTYQYNFTQIEMGSCLNDTYGTHNGSDAGLGINSTWINVNTTYPGTPVCGIFPNTDATDTIRINVKLSIPSDSYINVLNDTFIMSFATGTALC